MDAYVVLLSGMSQSSTMTKDVGFWSMDLLSDTICKLVSIRKPFLFVCCSRLVVIMVNLRDVVLPNVYIEGTACILASFASSGSYVNEYVG